MAEAVVCDAAIVLLRARRRIRTRTCGRSTCRRRSAAADGRRGHRCGVCFERAAHVLVVEGRSDDDRPGQEPRPLRSVSKDEPGSGRREGRATCQRRRHGAQRAERRDRTDRTGRAHRLDREEAAARSDREERVVGPERAVRRPRARLVAVRAARGRRGRRTRAGFGLRQLGEPFALVEPAVDRPEDVLLGGDSVREERLKQRVAVDGSAATGAGTIGVTGSAAPPRPRSGGRRRRGR